MTLALFAGCDNTDAILLLIRPPAGVQLSQYEVRIQDHDSHTLVYQSGIQPIDAVAAGRDLSIDPLKVGLKLSQAGNFLVFVRASTGTLVPDGSKPQQRISEYFFATLTQTSGTTEIDGGLLEVTPDFDRDFDHFPDAVTWPAANIAAKVRYQGQPQVLDCVDTDPGPQDLQLPPNTFAVQINPLAAPRCGLSIDVTCSGPTAPVCKDADGDGESEATDCDDHDPTRHHGNPRPRNCCTCTDHTSCGTDHSKLADQSVCQPARCNNPFDFDCTGQVVPCFVDDDCDGYSPDDPVPSQRDCDDTNPLVHPGAAKNCADATHDWACDGNPRGGCVACDLDGDGYQRKDSKCPDSNDIHPGQVDCDDTDSGVFPGSTGAAGATLVGKQDLNKTEGGGSAAAALRRLCFNKGYDGATPQDADCDGTPQNGCPMPVGGKICDFDGDGFPNNLPGCNPKGLLLDCDDNDYKTFPGAPDYCSDGKAQNCNQDTACSMDSDGDHYNADVDCDDKNPNRHPWATESCNGIDDDCDGLIDELNPDPSGVRLTEVHGGVTSIMTCTDSNIGDCGLPKLGPYPGKCVCSGLVPNKPLPGSPAHMACTGTRSDSQAAPKCFGATQPTQQTCSAATIATADQDCDGRTDAPDGNNLKEYGDACGVTNGSCVAGKVVGCDKSKTNPFSVPVSGHAVVPTFDQDRRFLVCDNTAVPPMPDLCDGKDNDCDGTIDDCTAGNSTAPKCCPMANSCIDLNTDPAYCGSCSNACSMTTANACTAGKCTCGTNPACTGTRGLCKMGMSASCVQCLLDMDCSGTTPKCKGADTCVGCLASTDCKVAPNLACNLTTNTCVGCVSSTDCKVAPNLACNTTTSTCVPCFANSDCKDPTKPVCDAGTNTCGCKLNSDCKTGPNLACNTTTNACVPCFASSDCMDPTKPVCDAATNTCGCKLNSDCKTAPNVSCNTTTYACVPCFTSADCMDPTKPVCDTTTYTCGCKANADCKTAPNQACNTTTNICVPCFANTDCKDPTKPACDAGTNTCGCKLKADCKTAPNVSCNTTTNTCVPCFTSMDCTDATKPVCDTGTYTCGCSGDADCKPTYTMCLAGVCS